MYVILNLCRVIAYVKENLVLSKRQGGEWGLANLPDKYHVLIRDALDTYRGDVAIEFDTVLAQEFCWEMQKNT